MLDIFHGTVNIALLVAAFHGFAFVEEFFALAEGDFDFVDSAGVHRLGHRKLIPAATVKAGRIYGSASIPVVHQ